MSSKLIAAGLLAATFCVNAAGSSPAAKPAASPAAKQDEVVCTLDHSTGSHIPKKVCTTRSTREGQAKADQDALKRMHAPVKANSASNR